MTPSERTRRAPFDEMSLSENYHCHAGPKIVQARAARLVDAERHECRRGYVSAGVSSVPRWAPRFGDDYDPAGALAEDRLQGLVV